MLQSFNPEISEVNGVNGGGFLKGCQGLGGCDVSSGGFRK